MDNIIDDELCSQLTSLRAAYDNEQITTADQRADILELLSILVANDIAIPGRLLDKYVKKSESLDTIANEEIPF